MPLESFSQVLPWEIIKLYLPHTHSLKELSIDSPPAFGIDVDDDSPPESCMRFKQEHVAMLAHHTPLIERLMFHCSIEGSVDLSSLSHLKSFTLEQSSIPKDAQITQLDLTLPESLTEIGIASEYRMDLSKFSIALKPLHALESIALNCSCFQPSAVKTFFEFLPLGIKKLEIFEILARGRKGESFEPTIVSIRLPRLRELQLVDSQFRTQQVFFEFALAPRLVGLSMRATTPQCLHTIRSLTQFPQCRDSTLTLQ